MKVSRTILVTMAAVALVSLYGCGKSTTSITSPLQNSLDTTPPSVPEDLALATTGDTSILSWTASPDADVAAYRVYEYAPAPGQDNAYMLLGQTSHTTIPVPSGSEDTVCHFRVKSVDTSGNESAFSTDFAVNVPGVTARGGQGKGRISE